MILNSTEDISLMAEKSVQRKELAKQGEISLVVAELQGLVLDKN
jgi:hypothetical protein